MVRKLQRLASLDVAALSLSYLPAAGCSLLQDIHAHHGRGVAGGQDHDLEPLKPAHALSSMSASDSLA